LCEALPGVRSLARRAQASDTLLLGRVSGRGVTLAAVGRLELNGDRPAIRVRRAYVKGHFKPPKSRYGKRAVPIDFSRSSGRCARRRRPQSGPESAS
jgi:hypothetical protein